MLPCCHCVLDPAVKEDAGVQIRCHNEFNLLTLHSISTFSYVLVYPFIYLFLDLFIYGFTYLFIDLLIFIFY